MRLTPNGFGVVPVLVLAFTLSACAGNMNAANVAAPSTPEAQSPSIDPVSPVEPGTDSVVTSIDAHQLRYVLKDTHTKLVDNRGNGFEALYGVRNFRAVLNGVVYRGGGNNAYNKYGVRANNNPLPTLGLTNLCKEGFSTGVYLYSTNYATAPKAVDCASNLTKAKTHLDYKQFNPTTTAGIKSILDTVYASIKDPSRGPVYLHCWNGWHASGLASAIVLRQFCGMSASAAVAYWDLNTDGTAVDSSYSGIRDRVRAYVPRAGYEISAAMKKDICPE